MASSMLPFQPVAVQAATTTTTTTVDGHKSPKWWAPLFGFSSEPDYINPIDNKNISKPVLAKTRFAPGSFTEKKAKQFRRMTCDASSFHETMYHSAIASRLASDFSNRIAN